MDTKYNDGALLFGENESVSEVMVLQAKLTKQMAYCTQLSKHAHELEKRASMHSTELKEKETTLRSALETLDALRTEKNQLRVKLRNSENSMAMISTELQESRVQETMGARRVDMVEAELEEAHATDASLRNEIDVLKRKNSVLETKCNKLEDRLIDLQDIGLHQKAKRLESELARAKASMRDESLRCHDLEAELQRQKADRQLDSDQHQRALTEIETLTGELRATKNKLTDAMSSEYHHKTLIEDLRNQIVEHTSRADRFQTAFEEEKQKTETSEHSQGIYKSQVAELETMNARLRQKLQEKDMKLAEQVASSTADKESAASRYKDLEGRLRTIVAEAREREIYQGDVKRATEARFQHKVESLDTQYVQLQNEYESMHELLLKVQNENTELTHRIDTIRKKYKEKEIEVSKAATACDERIYTEGVKYRAKIQKAEDRARDLQERLVGMMKSFVNAHEAMQSQLDRLRTMSGSVQEDCQSIRRETDAFHSKCMSASESITQPLIAYSSETKSIFLRLCNKAALLENNLEDSRDELVAAKLHIDTERGQLIMANESINHLKHEITGLQQARKDEEAHTAERLRASASECSTAQNLVEELETRVTKYIDQLTAANGQNAQLQKQCQELRNELQDAKDQHQNEYDAIKEMLETSEKSVRSARASQDELASELNSALRQLEMENQRAAEYQNEKSAMERVRLEADRRVQMSEQAYIHKIKGLKDELHALHEQLETTQQLYGKVAEARDTMREENKELKAEMAAYHQHLQDNIQVEGVSSTMTGRSPQVSPPKSTESDNKISIDSPAEGEEDGSFSIDDIRAEFEGFEFQ